MTKDANDLRAEVTETLDEILATGFGHVVVNLAWLPAQDIDDGQGTPHIGLMRTRTIRWPDADSPGYAERLLAREQMLATGEPDEDPS